MMATFMVMMVPRAEVCAERIEEVLETEPAVAAPARALPRDRGEVELRGVKFRYPGAAPPVLTTSASALPGRTTAIVGSTGGGKTTLVTLVPRLFDVTAGTLLVDGVDVRAFDPARCGRPSG